MAKRKTNEDGYETLSDFLRDHKKSIEKFFNVLINKTEKEPLYRLIYLISTFAIVGIIILVTYLLTSNGKLSSESFSFLMGGMVGYIFAFINRFLIQK